MSFEWALVRRHYHVDPGTLTWGEMIDLLKQLPQIVAIETGVAAFESSGDAGVGKKSAATGALPDVPLDFDSYMEGVKSGRIDPLKVNAEVRAKTAKRKTEAERKAFLSELSDLGILKVEKSAAPPPVKTFKAKPKPPKLPPRVRKK